MNEWNPIGFECPPDEYDCVVDQVVSLLHRGTTADGLRRFTCAEFAEHFGMPARWAFERLRAFRALVPTRQL